MSTKQGVHKCNRPAAAPAAVRKDLPMDILLEIVARCDVTTIIRCARATKFLRRAILEPAFQRRLTLQAAAVGGGFDPALLFGVSYLACSTSIGLVHRIIRTPSSIQLHARLRSFEPVVSRDHLLLLRRTANAELRVCDTTTGHVTSLPHITVSVWSYRHAFLSISSAEAGGSYELIVTDNYLRFQTFSSKHGKWDAVREPSFSGHACSLYVSSSVRVIGRTLYWLCSLKAWGVFWDGILALDVDVAEATTMELPQGSLSTMMSDDQHKQQLLASVRGRLSLLLVESCGISMWTFTPASSLQPAVTWSRQLIISTEEIVRPVGLVSSPWSIVLEEFGERSGAVIVLVDRTHLVRLDLGTKVVTRLNNPVDGSVMCLFLHETDLISLIKKSL